jgi:hypothetical protein
VYITEAKWGGFWIVGVGIFAQSEQKEEPQDDHLSDGI